MPVTQGHVLCKTGLKLLGRTPIAADLVDPKAGNSRWLAADIGRVAAKLGDLPLYSRRIHVKYRSGQELLPCPLKWLDSFSMRNFTNDQIFDDTLPLGDGLLEAGARVPLDRLRDAMEDWFRRKSYLPKVASLVVEE